MSIVKAMASTFTPRQLFYGPLTTMFCQENEENYTTWSFPLNKFQKRTSWLLGLQRDFTTISKWQICKVCWILCILFIVQNLKIDNNENSVRTLIFGTEGFWSWLWSLLWHATHLVWCKVKQSSEKAKIWRLAPRPLKKSLLVRVSEEEVNVHSKRKKN